MNKKNKMISRRSVKKDYDFISKNIHRASVLELYILSNASRVKRRPIAYLEDENGGATRFFLERMVPIENLIPINDCFECVSAMKKRTGVTGVHDDINRFVTMQKADSFSVVWLDYMCTSYDIDVIKQSLVIAPFVCITLSMRGKDRESLINDMVRMKEFSDILEHPHPYKGKSGYTNMVRCTLMRKNLKDTTTNTTTTTKKLNISKKSKHSENSKTNSKNSKKSKIGAIVKLKKMQMTGVILSDNGNTVSIEFDNSVRKSVKKELVELNEKVIEWTSLKDRYVRVPIGLWNDGTCPYRKSNRSIKNGILFKITKKHYKNVAINSVLKNGKLSEKAENWTLTREQAQHFMFDID